MSARGQDTDQGELWRLELLRRQLEPGDRQPGDHGVLLGIGDDAAVLRPPADDLVWSVDVCVEGVHFRREWLSFSQLGCRSLMAAASDLAAMGATFRGALASLVLPATVTDEQLEQLGRGQRQGCDRLSGAVLGGNLSRGGELSVTTTVLGSAARPLRRDGARPGDQVLAAGELGLAAAGLRLLQGAATTAALAAARPAIRAWRDPLARVTESLAVAPWASAAIDVSDGLARDLTQLARASNVSVVLQAAALRRPELTAAAELLGCEPLELALHGGEDYALIVTLPPSCPAPAGFYPIGSCEPPPRAGGEGWLWLALGSERCPVPPRGFDHFGPPAS